MDKYINLEKITNGALTGDIRIIARGWETRYSWGHEAYIMLGCTQVAYAKYRYYNRTWESYRFQSVLHGVVSNYVQSVTGLNPHKPICDRDTMPMKGEAAEKRRLARVAAHDFAATLYRNITAILDGFTTEDEIAKRFGSKAA